MRSRVKGIVCVSGEIITQGSFPVMAEPGKEQEERAVEILAWVLPRK